ncbi:DUF5683 domain-containing protein [Pedobacter frigoris]|uniref:DUF5683 domain-containing protein n=1 Tax=Pedobacter frigoris TaxID=2571272 RepID=UPI00292CB6A2|nr:DUF5683 domain-containing protein [Pedobacter frigoris]
MYRAVLVSVLFLFTVFTAVAQVPVKDKKDSLNSLKDTTEKAKPMVLNAGKQVKIAVDTGKTKYVNQGKIAGRRAAISSMMLPGLGQIRNGVTVYRLAKVAGIYTGATFLTLSYIDNNKMYKVFLKELQYRKDNPGKTQNVDYARVPTDGMILAKDNARRNREVVTFSFVGLYLLNVVEAYIDARLKYFDVGDIAGIKLSPGLINTNDIYGFNQVTPGIKLSMSF